MCKNSSISGREGGVEGGQYVGKVVVCNQKHRFHFNTRAAFSNYRVHSGKDMEVNLALQSQDTTAGKLSLQC